MNISATINLDLCSYVSLHFSFVKSPLVLVFHTKQSCLTQFSIFPPAVNLREDPNQPFNPHPGLGKYFKGFTGTRYIPNESLQQQYPEDVITDEDSRII